MNVSDDIEAKLGDFFGNYHVKSYPKGQILILNGENTDYIYQLCEGQVKQYDISYRGDEVVLNIFLPPAFFPMSLAINRTPNHFTYEAQTNIKIRQVPAAKAVEFVKQNPDVMYNLLSRVFRGTDDLLMRMSKLMSGSAQARLMLELQLACRRFGKTENNSCKLELKETDLAARTGLSRETVSRTIRQLANHNLILASSGKITIKDMEKFNRKLDSMS